MERFYEKSSCSFGFCPNEGGGRVLPNFFPLFSNCIYWVNLGMEREGETPAQIFFPLFTNCIYWVNLGMGREGKTPAQYFLAHWRSKKVV